MDIRLLNLWSPRRRQLRLLLAKNPNPNSHDNFPQRSIIDFDQNPGPNGFRFGTTNRCRDAKFRQADHVLMAIDMVRMKKHEHRFRAVLRNRRSGMRVEITWLGYSYEP